MAACPKCAASIEADFGVLNCPSCGTMLSVNFDGSVDLSEEDNLAPTHGQPEEAAAAAEDFNFNGDSFVEDSSLKEISQVIDPAAKEESFVGTNPLPLENKPIESQENVMPQPVEDYAFTEEAKDNVFEAEEEERTRVLETDGFQDVEAFGNQEISNKATGGVLYDLRLEGIDTAELREEIRLELSDNKYRLNVTALMNSIHNGILTIRDLTAVKAALIVGNLKHLNIEMQWKQNEIIRM